MRIIAFSDTHRDHRKVIVPEGDVLIFAGDFARTGVQGELESFLRWFSSLPHKHKIMIAGNHDKCLEYETTRHLIPKNVTYLQDEFVIVEGLKIYGSPWTPAFGRWAFQKSEITEMVEVWNQIPEDTDILVTHGPPHGILDAVTHVFAGIEVAERAGCVALGSRIQKVKPKLHIFGHIHEGQGSVRAYGCLFVNASFKGRRFLDGADHHQPWVIDWNEHILLWRGVLHGKDY